MAQFARDKNIFVMIGKKILFRLFCKAIKNLD